MAKLKIFIWENYCPDWADGLAFVIARTQKQANKILQEKEGQHMSYPERWGKCKVYALDDPHTEGLCKNVHGSS